MRISLVTTHYPPVYGGVSTVVDLLASFLTKAGHEVRVFTTWHDGLKRFEGKNGVKIFRCRETLRLPRGFNPSIPLFRVLIKKLKECEIVHSHDYGYFPASAALVVSKLRNVPHVHTPHIHPPVFGPHRKLLFNLHHLVVGRQILRLSSKIIALSNEEKNYLKMLGAKNVEVIPDPIDAENFKPIEGIKKENIVLFVGVFRETKGIDVIGKIAVEILRQRKDIKFAFVGPGGRHERIIANLKTKFPENVLLEKKVSQELLRVYYNKAKVVVLPSRYEAFGITLAEAQACGTPVVATKVGGIPEVVRDGKTGFLVDYGEWDKMKELIENIVDNNRLRSKIGRNARAHAEKFGIKAIGKKHLELYESLAKI